MGCSQLSGVQVAGYVRNAGFPSSLWATMVAIAYAESTFYPCSGENTGYVGLWQIGSNNGYSQSYLLNPTNNARAALLVYQHQGLNAWSTYRFGGYRSYLGMAQSAVNALVPQYKPVYAQVLGTVYPAIGVPVGNTEVTYLDWAVVQKMNFSYTYLGNGKMTVNGKTIQGVIYNGTTYLPWTAIPGIVAIRTSDGKGWNFVKSSRYHTALGAVAGVAVVASALS